MLATPDTRIEFERGMSYLPRITMALIVTYIAVFIWEIASGALTSVDAIVAAGALYRPRVEDGEFWRLATATFLHGGAGHLIGNCLVLYVAGMGCEHAFGTRGTLIVYAGSAIAGSVLSVVMLPGPSVGASGLIFGVMAALVVYLVRNRDRYRLRDARIALVMGVFAAWGMGMGWLTPLVDNYAHLGGAAGGALLAVAVKGDEKER